MVAGVPAYLLAWYSFASPAHPIDVRQMSVAADMGQFLPPADAVAGNIRIQGRLRLETEKPLKLEAIRDDNQFARETSNRVDLLPVFDFRYVQDGTHLIPVTRGAIAGAHPMYNYILEPGRIWQDPEKPENSRVSLPFTLQERNANCMHNGMMGFSIRRDGTLSRVSILIASETCMYLKFNLSGSLAADYQPTDIPEADATIAAFRRHREARLATQPLKSLAVSYPDVDLHAFTGAGRLPEEDISLYGYVIDDVHYRGDCQTRRGMHPLCDDMSLPSYSLAKTLLAGVAAMRLEKIYPGSRQALIADYVPECRESGNWGDVTFEQALNMVTGNFDSPVGRDDETGSRTVEGFFSKSRHRDKIVFSCDAWPRKAVPGSRWAYHTTDTYILGTAMNALLTSRRGPGADMFEDLVLPLWKPMVLSPATAVTLRSDDEKSQPYAGYGLTLLADDIARLATALNRGTFEEHLDSAMFDSAMQRLPEPAGYYPVDGRFYYRHGFFAYNAQFLLACDKPVMIPFMSGYGGINVVMMPNDSIYYIFNDGGKFAFTDVLVQSHRMRSMCAGVNSEAD